MLLCHPSLITPARCCCDMVGEAREGSRRLVSRAFPQLLELVENGTLLVLERSPLYVERRQDGFQEPLLLFLVGTSHISSSSAAHAYQVVTTVHPQSVIVELCRSRAGLMNEVLESNRSHSNLMSITGKSFSSALGRSLELGGQSAMTLRFLLALVSEKLSSVAGVRSGEELRRAWEALNWLEKLKLAAILLRGISSPKLDLSEESLQALRSDDAVSTMFNYLSTEFPTLIQPLIHERDKYLAWSLTRSKAVNGNSRVVGIIGRGHMKGVIHALKYEQGNLRFRDLVRLDSNAPKHNAALWSKKLLVDTVLAGFLMLVVTYYKIDIVSLLSTIFVDSSL